MTQDKKVKKVRAENRKANFDVAVEERIEAGLVLSGDEIKSIRADRIQLTGSFIRLVNGQVKVVGMHLSLAAEPERTRSILLHASEIETLRKALQIKGKVAVPLDVHFHKGWAKLTIGIGSGRKNRDKRQLLKERDQEREQRQELKRS